MARSKSKEAWCWAAFYMFWTLLLAYWCGSYPDRTWMFDYVMLTYGVIGTAYYLFRARRLEIKEIYGSEDEEDGT